MGSVERGIPSSTTRYRQSCMKLWSALAPLLSRPVPPVVASLLKPPGPSAGSLIALLDVCTWALHTGKDDPAGGESASTSIVGSALDEICLRWGAFTVSVSTGTAQAEGVNELLVALLLFLIEALDFGRDVRAAIQRCPLLDV